MHFSGYKLYMANVRYISYDLITCPLNRLGYFPAKTVAVKIQTEAGNLPQLVHA